MVKEKLRSVTGRDALPGCFRIDNESELDSSILGKFESRGFWEHFSFLNDFFYYIGIVKNQETERKRQIRLEES